MQEPAEHRGGDGGVTEGAGPVGVPDVCRQDRRGFQIPLVDHLEQGGCSVFGQGEVAEFVDDQEFRSGEEVHAGLPAAFECGFVTLGGQLGCGGEVDAVSGLDRGPGQGDREHGLADPGRADEQHVGGVVEEAQGGQVADEFLVDAGLGGEVEVLSTYLG
nr:hypothetical protein [Streptomyces melanosporofaciens]